MTNEQLAQLMIGMAKANVALVRSVSDQATIMQNSIPAMQSAARITPAGIPLSLDTVFARMLLQSFGTPGPDVSFYAGELDRLTSAG